MDDRANTAFAAWPERLVLVDADRRIVYPGRAGPWGFSPEEAEEQLVALLGTTVGRDQEGTGRPEDPEGS